MLFGIDRAYIMNDMKKMIEMFAEIIRELRKDLDVYMTIQRYARASHKEKRGITMKNGVMTIMMTAFLGLASVHTAFAYVLDGNLNDWGVTPGTQWAPSTSITGYVVENNVSHNTTWIWGGLQVDIQALYIDIDSQYFNYAIVSSKIQQYSLADLRIDINASGNNLHYGLDITPTTSPSISGPLIVANYIQYPQVYKNPIWMYMYTSPAAILGGTVTGTSEAFYKNVGVIEAGEPTSYIIEGRIPKSLFSTSFPHGTEITVSMGRSIYDDPSEADFSKRWLIDTAFSDYIELDTTIVALDTTVVPEPGSMALIFTGFFGYMIGFARKRFREFKRIFDTMLSAIGIVVFAPAIGFTALIIKIVSPGPVFYKQERVGWGGRLFNIYKMRTMRVDAEKYTGPIWAKENDSRLIKFGKIIRRLHIDELPQLFNVLRGDMSIVGPRPERPVFVRELSQKISDYEKRINVRPGITGLAQVWHKYDETIADVRKKVKYDLLYIREMCLMVDIRIILRTVLVAARGKGAR